MTIPREILIEEARSRGLTIPDESPEISREELLAEARRRGIPIPGEKKEFPQQAANALSYLNIPGMLGQNILKTAQGEANPLGAGIESFGAGVEKRTHGLVQPILENYLGPKVAEASKEVAREREQRFRQNAQQFPIASNIGEFLGGEASKAPLYAAGGIALKSLPSLSNAPGFLKYLGGILGSTASGGLGGASKYVNPGESRLANTLGGAGAGLAAGTLGAGIGLGTEAAIGAKNLASSYLKTHPAQKFVGNFVEKMKNAKDTYSKGYGRWESETEASGINNLLSMPKVKYKDILPEASKTEKKYLTKIMNGENTIKNAHEAQSDLGEIISRLKGLKKTASRKDAIHAATKAQKELRKNINTTLTQQGRSDLAQEYKNLTAGYKKDVIPYTTNPVVKKYEKGELTDEGFIKKLAGSEVFKKKMGQEQYPELYQSQELKKLAKNLTGGALGGAGYYTLHELLGAR